MVQNVTVESQRFQGAVRVESRSFSGCWFPPLTLERSGSQVPHSDSLFFFSPPDYQRHRVATPPRDTDCDSLPPSAVTGRRRETHTGGSLLLSSCAHPPKKNEQVPRSHCTYTQKSLWSTTRIAAHSLPTSSLLLGTWFSSFRINQSHFV